MKIAPILSSLYVFSHSLTRFTTFLGAPVPRLWQTTPSIPLIRGTTDPLPPDKGGQGGWGPGGFSRGGPVCPPSLLVGRSSFCQRMSEHLQSPTLPLRHPRLSLSVIPDSIGDPGVLLVAFVKEKTLDSRVRGNDSKGIIGLIDQTAVGVHRLNVGIQSVLIIWWRVLC